jgi:hypothetical protein
VNVNEPDYQKAPFVYHLLTDYHQAAQSIKALRSAQLDDASREAHRVIATGIFNRMYVLWQMKVIGADVFGVVISRRAAQLWLEHVAPLDKAVRERARGSADDEGAVHPMELFYRAYADGRLI